MNDLQKSFLQAVLGKEGKEALLKATAKEPRLLSILVPRVIVSWVEQNPEHEGIVPGVPNSFVQFSKFESGYVGCLALEDGVYSFDNTDIYHVSAAIGLSIGYEHQAADTQIRDAVLRRVGGSIDLLTKAQVVAKNLAKARVSPVKLGVFGDFHIEIFDGEGYAVIHTPTETPVQQDIKSFKEAEKIAQYHQKYAKPAKQPIQTEVDKAEATATTAKPIPPLGPKGPIPPTAKPPKPPSLSVTKSESKNLCTCCEKPQFKDGVFTGCLCLADLSKSVKTQQKSDTYILDFEPGFDSEALLALIKVFKNKGL